MISNYKFNGVGQVYMSWGEEEPTNKKKKQLKWCHLLGTIIRENPNIEIGERKALTEKESNMNFCNLFRDLNPW